MTQRIWIIGGSSGIGLELVKLWLAKDYRLVISSQNAQQSETLLDLQNRYPQNVLLLNLDVSAEAEQLKPTVDKAFALYNGLDVWFYNVGSYHVMGLDDFNVDHFTQMNSTNYLGAVKLMTLLTPHFRAQKSGRWIWNVSLSSYFGLPQGGGYSAPKAALLNLAESLQPELLLEGIEMQVINHGFVKTRLTAKNSFEMPQLMEPSYAAQRIVEGMNRPYHFEMRFPFGLGFFLRLLRFLPYRFSLYLTRKMIP